MKHPSLEATIADLVSEAKTAEAVTPLADYAAERARIVAMRKFATALRDLPDPTPTYDDLYTVKRLFHV